MNYIKKLYSGRIGRTQYILGLLFSVLAYLFLTFLGPTLLMFLGPLVPDNSFLESFILGAAMFYAIAIGIVFGIYYLSLHVRRLHDLGMNGWWSLLYVFPPFHLLLMFIKGREDKNHYSDTPPSSKQESLDKPKKTFVKNNWFKLVVASGIVLVLILVLIATVVFVSGFSGNNQQRLSACRNFCNFNPVTKIWSYGSAPTPAERALLDKYGGTWMPVKYFQSQEQCVNYCLAK